MNSDSPQIITSAARRDFLKTGVATLATVSTPGLVSGALLNINDAVAAATREPESIVKDLFGTLTERQRKSIQFAWDHADEQHGLLRAHVDNNWHITKQKLSSKFFTDEQREMTRAIFEGIIHPDWLGRYEKQMKDDAGGFGSQSIALFGDPDSKKFEFVITGRHMTLRCDGNSAEHVAFGGPIFYGHDPLGEFYEGPKHEQNVFWEQAVEANKVYDMLDEKQREQAKLSRTPREGLIAFKGESRIPGLPVAEMSDDQQAALQKVLQKLVEPYRKTDQQEALQCLKQQGGLKSCYLSYYTDKDIGDDGVWDNWRLEGPAFVWHYRGAPHVHVWVNIAENSKVKTYTPILQKS